MNTYIIFMHLQYLYILFNLILTNISMKYTFLTGAELVWKKVNGKKPRCSHSNENCCKKVVGILYCSQKNLSYSNLTAANLYLVYDWWAMVNG